MTRKHLSGQVMSPRGGVLGGLLVEAWSLTADGGPIASAFSSDSGAFLLALDEEAAAHRRISLRIFSGARLLATLEGARLDEDEVSVVLREPAEAPPPVPVHVVRGRVRASDGTPVIGARVAAFDRDLRSEQLLGEAVTDRAGRYDIRYPAELRRAGKRAPDLVVRVLAGETAVAESALRYDAPASLRLDLDLRPGLRPGLSVFEQVEAALAPLVEATPLEELLPADLAYAAGKTGLPEETLRDVVRGAQLSTVTGIAPAACFAFVRHGLPAELTALLTATRADLEAALGRAFGEGLIPASLESEVGAIIARVNRLRTAHPLRRPAGEVTFGTLMTAAGVSRSVQETFVRLVSAHAGPVEHLWRKLKNHPDGGTQATIDMGFALQAAALARGDATLVEHLADLRKRGTITTLRELAGLEPSDWRKRLDEAGVATPADAPGADDDERRDAFARWLSSTLEAGFPTAALVQRLARDAELAGRPAIKYLVDHPDFELATDRPRDHAPPALVRELERLQRLYRLSPRYRHVRGLQRAGLDSAFAVASAGPELLARELGPVLAPGDAERLHGAASRVALRAFSLLAEQSPALRGPDLAAIPAPAPLPGLAEVAGVRPLCSCPECRTVLGPAAYLADLLGFLRDRRVAGGRTALDALFDTHGHGHAHGRGRRADLGVLPLDCATTETRVPRLDSVLALLEHAVAAELEGDDRTALAAGRLATTTFPLGLPFDLPRTQAKIFLEHLGVTRRELMAAFQRRDRATGLLTPGDGELAAEELGLLPAEVELVTGGFRAAAPVRVATRAALNPRGLPVVDGASLVAGDRVLVKHQPDPADDGVYVAAQRPWTRATDAPPGPGLVVEVEEGSSRGLWVQGHDGFGRLRPAGEIDALPRQPWEYWGFPDDHTITDATWPEPLRELATLLARTGLAKEQLEEILEVPWVNPGGEGHVSLDASQPGRVPSLGAAAARRILRFARLLRRVGWSAHDLGRALHALAPREITDRSLLALAELRRLMADTGLPLDTLLALYIDLDAESYGKVLVEPAEPLQLVWTAEGPEPRAEGKLLSDVAAPVAAALGLSVADVRLLVDRAAAARLDLDAPVPDKLSLRNVSRLARRVVLARAAGLSIADVLVLLALTGASPFDGEHIDETRRFLATAGKLKAAGLTVSEANALLRGLGADEPTDAATLEAVAAGAAGLEDQAELEAFVVRTVADALGLDLELTRVVLCDALHDPGRGVDAVRAGGEDALAVLRKLRRTAWLARKLGLTGELLWYVRRGPELRFLEPDRLPAGHASVEEAAARFPGLERLLDYVAARAWLPGTEPALSQLLATALDSDDGHADAGRARLLAALAGRTGWPLAELEAITAGLGLAFPADFRDVRTLARLRTCLELVQRTGVSAARLVAWRGSPFTMAEADDIVAAVAAKTDPAAWPGIAAPLHGAVHTARRDALVTYLLHARGLSDVAALSDHFLVDVLTTDEAPTSRMDQAIGSVQRFVERAFLGLEPEAHLGPEDARRWRWMRDLASWREHRRHLLNPRLELLGGVGGTPFLATALGSLGAGDGDPTEALAVALEELDGVARLEIAGLHHDPATDTLHLVGRTHGRPPVHHYRARSGAAWGPWELVGGDLAGEPAIPLAWDGRVAVVWPVASGTTVALGFSERQRGGFAPRRVSRETLDAGGDASALRLRLRTRASAQGEPLVTVLAEPAAGPARGTGPLVGDAPARGARVLGTFRVGARGPVVAESGGAAELIALPLAVPGQLRLPREDGTDVLVLGKAPRHRVVLPHRAGATGPLVYEDGERSYLVSLRGAGELPWGEPSRWTPALIDALLRERLDGTTAPPRERLVPELPAGRYLFERLDHPHLRELLRRLASGGVDALYAGAAPRTAATFEATYEPSGAVEGERDAGSFARTDRELFLDLPLLAAEKLAGAGRRGEAQRWLHRVFDPTDAAGQPWRAPGLDELDVDAWVRGPLDPRAVARARAGAQKRAVVGRYLDNLLDWADELIAKGATESAALLLRLAAQILGPRPAVPAAHGGEAPTFESLTAAGNVLVAIEDLLPGRPDPRPVQVGDGLEVVLALGRTLTAFCVPASDGLLGHWDRVAERLHRIH